ncbi:MAG: LPS export ABC transporter periplasmic protein LptC [Muribaculaceae bacterium]|nr:LPS export ABC transporter periplasmic protein LptC [Muribaculaceae bacterium]
MKLLPVYFLVFIIFSLFWSCREESKVDISRNLDSSKMASMSTRNISTLISDSGVTQYKIISPLWNIYDEAENPYWSFPEGLYLQKYDKDYNVIATVAADSAKFFKNERLWRLEGEVEMTKFPDELFLSPRVFWDQRQQQLYSDTFIHIENSTHVIEGTGFESDESLSRYRILHPNGIFPVNKDSL